MPEVVRVHALRHARACRDPLKLPPDRLVPHRPRTSDPQRRGIIAERVRVQPLREVRRGPHEVDRVNARLPGDRRGRAELIELEVAPAQVADLRDARARLEERSDQCAVPGPVCGGK